MRTPTPLLLVLGSVLLFSVAATARAQQGAAPPPATPAPAARTQSGVDNPEADESLNLTQDQKDRIKAIRDDAAQQTQAAQKDATLTEDQKERKIKEIRKATRAKVFAVLTPEQQKTWAQNRREQREAKSKDPKTP